MNASSFADSQMRAGSALIMTIGFVVLVVSLGSVFLVNAAAKYDESISLKLTNYAEQATQTAFAHARRELLLDYVNNTYSSYQSGARMDFYPLDTSGDPMHHKSELFGKNDNPDPRVNAYNSDRVTLHMAETYQGSYNATGLYDSAYGLNLGNDRSSRYHDIFFVDSNGNVTDELLADYVVRYTAEISDEEAKFSINPDYPGHPLAFDYTDPDNPDYLACEAYIHRYAKGIRSFTGAVAQEYNRSGFHKDQPRKKLYHVYDQIFEGSDNTMSQGFSRGNNGTEMVRYDRLFRGIGLTPEMTGWNSYDHWMQTIPGKVFSYGQIKAHWMSGDHTDDVGRKYSPYTTGLRDQSWPAGEQGRPPRIGNIPNPNCPWHINAVTMSQYTMQSMIFGLSSHLRSIRTDANWSKKGNTSTLDLFGPNYPEAFPLAMDAGKAVHLIGGDLNANNKIVNGTVTLPKKPDFFSGSRFRIPLSYANSYWWDVAASLYKATLVAKSVWNWGVAPGNLSINHSIRVQDPNSKISTTPADLSANRDQMLADLEAEFLRIIGEDVDISAGGAGFSYILREGLLATPKTGATVTVGFGDQDTATERSSGPTDRWNRSYGDITLASTGKTNGILAFRNCKLTNGENTRAMEYLLNDVRMSIFGTPALNFNHDDADLDGTPETAADSDDAESTVNGWWDYDNSGNRIRKWSWWYEGVPLTHDPANQWLEYPTWYRFYSDSGPVVQRWDGEAWLTLTTAERNLFFAVNKAFLNERFLVSGTDPIKPFSASGRLYVGHSHVFNIVARGELYDINLNQRVTQFTAEQFLHIDPNHDNDLSDTTVLYQRTYSENKSGVK